ncbi:MAG: hypothetical protein VX278_22270 [Myxococcota bacterium]|nr:hypothetical protein [Myxococcota bacterium]
MHPLRKIIPIFIAASIAWIWMFIIIGEDYGQLANEIPGEPNDDGFNAIYLHHMVHDALRNGRFDLSDPNQLYPIGFPQASTNGGNSLEMIASGLLRFFYAWPKWFGLSHYIWIPLNTLSFVVLGRYLWQNWYGSIAAGLTWSILPFTIEFMRFGRLTQTVQFGLPIATLGFLLLVEKGGRRAVWALGLGMIMCAWSYWFFAIFMVVLSPIFLIYGSNKRDSHRIQKEIQTGAFLFFVGITPLLLMVYAPVLQGKDMPKAPVSTAAISPLFPDALRLFGEGATLISDVVPITLIACLLVGFWKAKRRILWLSLTFVSFFFAMGPALKAQGMIWIFPYYYLWKGVPTLNRLLHPERWLLVGGLFLVVLSMDGLVRWSKRNHALKILVLCLPLCLLYELNTKETLPLKTWKFNVPEVWKILAAEEEGGIISVPVMNSQLNSRYQPFHGKPLLGGMVENQPWNYPKPYMEFVQGNGLLMALFALSKDAPKPFEVYAEDLEELREKGFRYIVYDKASWDRLSYHKVMWNQIQRNQSRHIRYLKDALGEPAYTTTDGDFIWYLPSGGKKGRGPAAGGSIRSIGPHDDIPEDELPFHPKEY